MQDPRLIKDLQLVFSKSTGKRVIELGELLLDRRSFNIVHLEDLFDGTRGVVPPFRHDDVLIIFVKTGSGDRSVGHYKFRIANNTLTIVNKRVIHAAHYTEKPTGYFISFNPDFFLEQAFSYKLLNEKKVFNPSLSPSMVVSDEQAAELSALFEMILEECNSGFDEKRQMIALKILELLIICGRYFSEKAQKDLITRYSDTVEGFNQLIEQQFTRQHQVRFYADALHTHPNHLNYVVKRATGHTAKQLINNRVLLEARYLLASTTLSVKEIAFGLGFEDPNYFISFFRRHQHTTPAQYRLEIV